MSKTYSRSRRGIFRKLLIPMAVMLLIGMVVLLGSPALAASATTIEPATGAGAVTPVARLVLHVEPGLKIYGTLVVVPGFDLEFLLLFLFCLIRGAC